jgi:hypothetical protein
LGLKSPLVLIFLVMLAVPVLLLLIEASSFEEIVQRPLVFFFLSFMREQIGKRVFIIPGHRRLNQCTSSRVGRVDGGEGTNRQFVLRLLSGVMERQEQREWERPVP